MYRVLVLVLRYGKDSIFYFKASEISQLFEQIRYNSSSFSPYLVKKC